MSFEIYRVHLMHPRIPITSEIRQLFGCDMRRIILAFFAIFLLAINAYAQPYQFDDEFNGSSLNTNLWTAVTRPGSADNQEIEYYVPSNVAVKGGSLAITTEYKTTVKGYPYTSGLIQMKNFNFLYGTVEFRAKFPGTPSGSGAWSAVWLLGAQCQHHNLTDADNNIGVDPTCQWPYPGSDEIDIVENLYSRVTVINNEITTQAGGTETDGVWSGGTQINEYCRPTVSDISANWHVYKLIWEPGVATFYVDGEQTCQQTSYVPDTPMFLIIDTAIGPGGGVPVPSDFPEQLLVDYVHITTDSTPIYPVIPSVSGPNGTISPSSVVTVNPGNTTAFTVRPDAGYLAVVGGTCGGSLSGNTYTTDAITGPCTVTAGFNRQTVPGQPTILKRTSGNAAATVNFTLPSNGESPIKLCTATSKPGAIKGTGVGSPITVKGLTPGKPYTFTVTATNKVGTGPASQASAPVIPGKPPGAPTQVKATAGNSDATVSFSSPASDGWSPITGYTVIVYQVRAGTSHPTDITIPVAPGSETPWSCPTLQTAFPIDSL